jgi:Tfp pilus assembly protein PilF
VFSSPPHAARSLSRRWLVHAVALIALPALVAVLYAPALDAPFLFDDQTSIVFNPGVQMLRPWAHFLSSNRPLTDLTLALNYTRGGSQPRAYHLTNAVLHAANGLLVYSVAVLALDSAAVGLASGGAVPWLALGAAALFVAHPLQTETAAYASARSEVLASFFYLLTVLAFALAGRAQRRRGRGALGTALPLVALPLTCAAALASKEMAATIPAALVLYDWCFIACGRWRGVAKRWPLFAASLVPLVLGVPILLRRDFATAGVGDSLQAIGPWQYLLTQFGVVVHYLRLTVVPTGLCFDTEWPLAHTLWSAQVLLPLGLLLGLAGVAVAAGRRSPVLTFAVLWVFVVLAPTSSVVPIADPVAERRMYLALLGPALLAVTAVWHLADRTARALHRSPIRPLGYGLLTVAMVGGLARLTTARVQLWTDPLRLYEDAAMKAPDNPRAHLNIGAAYLTRNQVEAAEPEVVEAQRLYERKDSVHATDRIGAFISLNLCSIAYRRLQFTTAAQHCQRALQLGRRFALPRSLANLYLGQIAVRQRQWPAAITYYQAAVRDGLPGIRVHALLHVADAYRLNGDLALARQNLEAALREDPDNADAAHLQRALDQTAPGG